MSKSDPYAAPSRMYAKNNTAPATVVEEPSTEEQVPSGTISEIKTWVDGDKDRAQRALDAEQASDTPRVTLIEYLTDLVGE